MNYGPLIFLAAFFALSASWFGFVLKPQIQIGREQPGTNMVNKAELYPQGRPGFARQGLEVYRANGCAYCHSQQVGQTGLEINVVLSKAGTNPVGVAEALLKANVGLSNINGAGISAGLPKTILHDATIAAARAASEAMRKAGAEARVDILPVGPDIPRWGPRRTVAQDFLYDYPVMPGLQRVGPDLANVGVRLPDVNWHLRHLYAPRTQVAGSPMPSYKFLFEEHKLQPGQKPSLDGIPLTAAGVFFDSGKDTGPIDREIVPKPEARALVAYLLSLRAITPLFETPMTVPAAPTSASATNAPQK
jgi:Cytochrome C oxidase, mono-heme subunit/FixO